MRFRKVILVIAALAMPNGVAAQTPEEMTALGQAGGATVLACLDALDTARPTVHAGPEGARPTGYFDIAEERGCYGLLDSFCRQASMECHDAFAAPIRTRRMARVAEIDRGLGMLGEEWLDRGFSRDRRLYEEAMMPEAVFGCALDGLQVTRPYLPDAADLMGDHPDSRMNANCRATWEMSGLRQARALRSRIGEALREAGEAVPWDA